MFEIIKTGIWIVASLSMMALISGSFEDRSIKKGRELVEFFKNKHEL